MLDHDAIRARVRKRFDDLGKPFTGKWLLSYSIGQTTLRNFLDGSTASLTVETVSKLADALETTEEWLLFGDRGISEDVVREMVATALEEVQPPMTFSEIRAAVASALQEQIAQLLAHDGYLDPEEARPGELTTQRYAPPTIRSSPARSRTS